MISTFFFEKIYDVSRKPKKNWRFFNFAKKIHDLKECDLDACLTYIYLNEIETEIFKKDLYSIASRLKFTEISDKYTTIFCTVDQLEKRLGSDVEKMETSEIYKDYDYECAKIKKLSDLVVAKERVEKEIEEITKTLL